MDSPKPGFGQLGPNVTSALKSDFFTFFHLRQVESATGDRGTPNRLSRESTLFGKHTHGEC